VNKKSLKTVFRNVIFLQERDNLAVIFKKAGIPVMALKGIYLLENVYKDIGARPMSDIDIMIKKEDILNAHDALLKAGYKTSIAPEKIEVLLKQAKSNYINSLCYIKNRDMRLCLNVHWHICNSSLPIYVNSNIYIDIIWNEARMEKDMFVMAPHHLLMYIAEHAFRHCFDSNIKLQDIAEVTRRFKDELDWNKFITDSVNFGLNRQVYYSLYLACKKTAAQVPDSVLNALKPEKTGIAERVFIKSVLAGKGFEELSCLVSFSACRGFFKKAGFLKGLIFPPRKAMAMSCLKPLKDIGPSDYVSRAFRGCGYIARGCFK